MKRYIVGPTLMVCLVLMVGLAFAADSLTVQVQTTKLRKDAKFWAPVLATLKAGDKVTLDRAQGDWVFVSTSAGQSGWLHNSAVTTKDIQLSDSGGTLQAGASTDEITLAGKGFTKEVEDEYGKTRGVSFKAVEAMSAYRVSDQEIEAFLKAGKLADWGVPR